MSFTIRSSSKLRYFLFWRGIVYDVKIEKNKRITYRLAVTDFLLSKNKHQGKPFI